eukprot:CAMPEP_0115877954 /NCGR_PEP_ID=MMETSP0287-20121206/26505_1 /TAXON_ID=412157 /ORGANISM="Chrysochromulina rotalis, Strain UIO044" /LENGTH=115 /DNA_ID=CAMNT_0003333517 /DNA_START=370 /DNA_END=717 /DNA_ORIENTATION=+
MAASSCLPLTGETFLPFSTSFGVDFPIFVCVIALIMRTSALMARVMRRTAVWPTEARGFFEHTPIKTKKMQISGMMADSISGSQSIMKTERSVAPKRAVYTAGRGDNATAPLTAL